MLISTMFITYQDENEGEPSEKRRKLEMPSGEGQVEEYTEEDDLVRSIVVIVTNIFFSPFVSGLEISLIYYSFLITLG